MTACSVVTIESPAAQLAAKLSEVQTLGFRNGAFSDSRAVVSASLAAFVCVCVCVCVCMYVCVCVYLCVCVRV